MSLIVSDTKNAIKLYVIKQEKFSSWLTEQSAELQAVFHNTYQNKKFVHGNSHIMYDATGSIERIYVCSSDTESEFRSQWADIMAGLPGGHTYVIENYNDLTNFELEQVCLALGLSSYKFSSYVPNENPESRRLVIPEPIKSSLNEINSVIESIFLSRNLINTPGQDLGPIEAANVFRTTLSMVGVDVKVYADDEVKKHWGTVYAVGQGASPTHAPRVVHATWGKATNPKIALIGKGVTFDTGGNNLKGGAGMRLMKIDMAGAATILALSTLIVKNNLPYQLEIIVPFAENTNSEFAMRPGDVYTSKSGKTVEIEHTDAEGRLLLCDALYAADQNKPDLIIDVATLTGANSTALGNDIAGLYTNAPELGRKLVDISFELNDPIWMMPLWKPYRKRLDSKVADIANDVPDFNGTSGIAGAITAALFLQEFIHTNNSPWMHLDTSSWKENSNLVPVGGYTQTLRALYNFLKSKPLQEKKG